MYYFIVNPNANRGHGGKVWKRLEHRLQRFGVEYEVMMTRAPGDAAMFASHLAGRNGETCVVVAVGGDGTVNEVLNGLSFGESIVFAHVPVGSGNDFAKSLRLPRSPGRCLKRILNSCHQRCLDYGVLSYENGSPVHRRFAVSSGLGFDAAVCHDLLNIRSRNRECYGKRRLLPENFVYVLLGARQWLRAVPVKGFLLLDGSRKVEFNHIYFISAHIHPYEGGGFRFAPKADGSDGLLEVCVVHNSSKLGLIPVFWDALLGKSAHHKGVRFYECREVQVHVEKPVPVHADGEDCYCQTDIHLRCIEKSIRMIV